MVVRAVFLAAWLLPSADAAPPRTLHLAGSSTVYPVALKWSQAASLQSSYTFIVEGGGSGDGAKRVCVNRTSPLHVDIGDMSRNWKSTEAIFLDDGYTLECLSSYQKTNNRVTQLQIGVDGLAMVVNKRGAAHDCLTNPEVGGLTLAEIRWIFSNWTNDDLAKDGVNISSILEHDDGDGIKEWSDLHKSCAELPINAYGPGNNSGTHDFFGSIVMCPNCFLSAKGYMPEYFKLCNATVMGMMHDGNATSYIEKSRPPNCYAYDEDDDTILDWVLQDGSGIAYLGFAYYSINAGNLDAAQIASDKSLGVRYTKDALIPPSAYTITDGSYSVFTRPLFMNVDNVAFKNATDYLAYGFGDLGQKDVARAGYIDINLALRAKMKARVEQGGNAEADYVPVPPLTCVAGTGMTISNYINAFGRMNVRYDCLRCATGTVKAGTDPIACSVCPAGRFAGATGQTACDLCGAGNFSRAGSAACVACPPGKLTQSPGQGTCANCTEGSHADGYGMSVCTFCKEGQFAVVGSQDCTNCSQNSVSAIPGSGYCTKCVAGTFTAGPGMSSCDRCPQGTYRLDGGEGICQQCPQDMTTQLLAATMLLDCACAEGTYHAPGGRLTGPCLPCPGGMSCQFGSQFDNIDAWKLSGEPDASDKAYPMPLAKPGYMTLYEEPMQVYKCTNLRACPGGHPGVCATNRDTSKVACGECARGAYLSNGECATCGKTDVAPFIIVTICSVLGVIAATVVVNRDLLMQSKAQLMCVIVLGLTFTSMQTLDVFQGMDMTWFEPITTLFRMMTLLSFDIKVLKFGCLPFRGGPNVSFAFRQCIAPAGVPLIMFTILVKKWRRPETNVYIELVNTVGALYQIFFMSMVVSATKPMICYLHPGDSGYSVVENPSILCYKTGEHKVMMTIGFVSLFFVPIPFLALNIYGTLKYPVYLHARSRPGTRLELRSFRFMFFRFEPSRYYYGLLLLIRGLLLCLVPVVIREDAGLQIFVMGVIIGVFILIQQGLMPWRSLATNYVDGALNMAILILLLLGALVSDISAQKTSVQLLGMITVIAFLVLVVLAVGAGIYLRIRPLPFYNMFLCHHKAHAAAQCRLLKTMLQRMSGLEIFIDSDDLKELDKLFDIVKCKVAHLVVFLTRDTLTRPWCAGEIFTAFHSRKTQVTAVRTPSFVPPTEEQLHSMDTYLDLSSTTLSQYGIQLEQVADAFRRLCSDTTPCVRLRQDLYGTRRFEMLATDLLSSRRSFGGKAVEEPPPVPDDDGLIFISADPHDDEAIAAACILVDRIQEHVYRVLGDAICLLPDFQEEIQSIGAAVSTARAVLVLCSQGSLNSLSQLVCIVEVVAAAKAAEVNMADAPGVVPISLPGFIFPTDHFYREAPSGPCQYAFEDVDIAIANIRSFFTRIAVQFPTHASDQIIKTQAQEVMNRIPTKYHHKNSMTMSVTKVPTVTSQLASI